MEIQATKTAVWGQLKQLFKTKFQSPLRTMDFGF